MVRGGAPCVIDCYLDYFSQFIREQELEDLFVFFPQEENHYYGLSIRSVGGLLAPVIALADLFVEMEQTLRVVGEPGSARPVAPVLERVSRPRALAAARSRLTSSR